MTPAQLQLLVRADKAFHEVPKSPSSAPPPNAVRIEDLIAQKRAQGLL